eukprot:INCI4330.1.p1 GENE.INCI4330.1~~INCI4330.1.p1  ORF type:complete len:372 (-),score=41.70 INCI4330.1:103-1140(-)
MSVGRKITQTLRALLVLLFLIAAICLVIAALLAAKPFLSRPKYDRFAQKLQHNYLLVFTWCIEAPAGRRVYFSGDTIPQNESALVVPNHAAAHGDWAPLYSLAARSNGLGSVKTVSKDILKFVPFFGWGMWLMQWPFLKRTWTSDKNYLYKKLDTYRRTGLPMLLWLFCEGTRWTRTKHAKAVSFARGRGQYEPVHTLVPKPTGFIALVRGLDGIVTHIHDVTLAYSGYPEHPDSKGPGFVQIFSPILTAGDCSFHIHVRRVPLKDLPLGSGREEDREKDDAQLKKYLFDMYQRKDELLQAFKRDGKFPGAEPKEIPLDPEASVQLLRHAAGVVATALLAWVIFW